MGRYKLRNLDAQAEKFLPALRFQVPVSRPTIDVAHVEQQKRRRKAWRWGAKSTIRLVRPLSALLRLWPVEAKTLHKQSLAKGSVACSQLTTATDVKQADTLLERYGGADHKPAMRSATVQSQRTLPRQEQ